VILAAKKKAAGMLMIVSLMAGMMIIYGIADLLSMLYPHTAYAATLCISAIGCLALPAFLIYMWYEALR